MASCGSLGHIWLGASRLMLGQGCGARQEVLISKSVFFFFLASIKSTFHSGRLGVGEKIFCHPGARNLVHGGLYLKPRWHCSAQEGIFLLIFPQTVPSDAAEVCAAYSRVNRRALLLLNGVVAAPEGQKLPLGFLSSP